MNKRQKLRKEVRHYVKCGVHCQHELFNRIYPTFTGHYSTLRDVISEVKNNA